jgi:uncharacterized membrane protein YgcG
MKPMHLLWLSCVVAVCSGSVAAQDIKDLVRIDATNQSATPEVTRSIAAYIATRNSAATVRTMAQTPAGEAHAVTVEALLAAIESNAGIVPPAPQAQQSAPKLIKAGGGNGGGTGGGSSGGAGGAGGGGGGGW